MLLRYRGDRRARRVTWVATLSDSDGDNPTMTYVPLHVIMVCTGNICRSAMAEIVLTDRLLAAGTPVLRQRPFSGSDGDREAAASGVVVTSAGVSDEERGNPIDPRAARVLAEHGYGQGADPSAREVAERIRSHRARRITDAELLGADLVLAMTTRHLRELERRAVRLTAISGAGTEEPAGGSRTTGDIRMTRTNQATGSAGLPATLAGPRLRLYRAVDPVVPGAGQVPDVPDPWYGTMTDFENTLTVVERVSDALAGLLVQESTRR